MYPDESEIPLVLAAAHERANAFLASLSSRRPGAPYEASDCLGLDFAGKGAVGSIELLWDRYGDAFSGSSGPRYWGFIHGGLTPAALAADWLCSAVDQTGQMHSDSPGVAIEHETIGMLRDLFGLPSFYEGIFVSGGTMANFTGLAVGVQSLGSRRGVDVSARGVQALGRVHVLAGECHASIPKACALLGLGRESVEFLPRQPGRESVDIEALADRLAALEGKPIIVVGNAGTVATGDFDDLESLGILAKKHGAFFHVDGAFGLFAGASSKYRHLVKGIERADTIAGDAHKWLNVPHDSGFVFSRHLDHQLEMFKNLSSYLPPPSVDPLNVPNLGPENTRRLRALPAWATLQAYGREGYQEIVERSASLAATLGELIREEPGFSLLAPVRLNVVCFELIENGEPLNMAATKAFVDRVTADGRVRVSSSMFEDRPCVRLAILNWRTTAADLTIAMSAFRACRNPASQRCRTTT